MMSEEEDQSVNMTEDELQHWVREQVEKDEQLVQRKAQLAQVDAWVKQKEREATHTQLLYNNACESVRECESVMKGLYGMLGLEYRDTDSEEEGGAKTTENVRQITDDFDNGKDEHGANVDDDYVVIDLGAVKEEPKEVELSAGIESSEFSVEMLAQKVKKTEAVDPPTEVNPPLPSTTRKNRPSDTTLPTIKTLGSPAPITASSLCDLPAQSLTPTKESFPPVSSDTSIPMNEPVKITPLKTIPDASSTSKNDTETPSEKSVSMKQNDETQAQCVASTPTSTLRVNAVTASKSSNAASVMQKPASKNKSSKATVTSDTTGKTTTKEEVKHKQASPKSSSKPSSTTTSSNTTVRTASAEKAKAINPKQGDKPETKAPTSSPHSGTTDTSTSDKASKKTISTNPPDANEVSQTSSVTPVTPVTSVTPAMPPRLQKEVMLKVTMSVLGRRRTKTWHQGTILDIKTTESGPRYKILFDGGKGKSVLSAHHLACVGPPMLKDIFVGCRVVACYKEDKQSWLLAAVVVEMPERRNRMRFLVFFDDGRPAYISLPDLHLVCKPMNNMSEDIEDEVWRAEVEEYLQAYPNPIFVVMRVGQDSKVERDGKMEQCTVSQVDSSLIQICYKKDQEKEWLYKGSNRLDQIQRIKKRMAEKKKEQAVNKGWISLQKNTNLPTTTATNTTTTTATSTTTTTATSKTATSTTTTTPTSKTATSTTTTTPTNKTTTSSSKTTTASTATSPTTVTINIEPLKTSTTPGVSQTFSPVTTSSSMIKTFAGKPISQPRVVLNRITLPLPLMTVKTTAHTEPKPTVAGSSNIGTKRPPSEEEEDSSSQNDLLPVVEPGLKYVPHRCCPACLNPVRPMQRDKHRGQNPLLIPLLHGFRRMTARKRLDGKMSFHVFYRAPCGRSMCEMEEVQAFLFESRCDFLFLDMFCLDPFVLVKRALLPSSMASRPLLFLPDISGGKEAVPVSCVNELNTVSPPPLSYTSHRLPAPGVFINTDLDFMVGCDCTDGCRDRSKCACYQMTIEATSLFTGGPVDVTAGYTHKRLPRYVPTGVYECNALCRCDPWLCGNRLVQHGLQLRLEVFMTQHKGWGLRCLDDMSKGTFVCVFTGKVVKDEVGNADSAMTGNEYLANLDYIEGVEKLKQGYESEAYCSDTQEESNKKTLVTMTTGALKKHGMFQMDSSSGEEKEETTQQKMERKTPGKRERKTSDDLEEYDEDDDDEDEDYKISSNDSMGAEWKYLSDDCKRSYTTRRNAKIPGKFQNNIQTSPKISEQQNEVTSSVAKKRRNEGPGGRKLGFAKKSTHAFAVKSSHRRVKPQAVPEKHVQEKKTAHDRKCTRSLFNGEKTCYLIDAKQEGNLARYINHSCSPNLFVQNVFVDTHDLRFPWVAFFTSKRIRAGTELTWDYSYEVGSVEGKVLLCCCGSSECTGRLL
ncbi:hypothetical protein AMELA_G00171020 [Ameiurus melas]|uniref:[histone H3]-lysine(4) N-trimethyltransferase n=1 Tax=Ameiurus melas TaxID=219545 RepID=A0A7J6AC35_AMEME|nr:hypothetical protein AMELA_G00171020 [Ameiurus melas]